MKDRPLLAAMRDFFIHSGRDKKYWIAYSGGLDSHVLLSLCHQLQNELRLQLLAFHVNHGLSPYASAWAFHCKQVCHDYGIAYLEQSVTIDCQMGESLEQVAREKRYAVFAAYLGKDEILLTAHHQDDQAETVLLQLVRGAGLPGLAAMPAIKPFAQGRHARPLLPFPREQLKAYAQNQGLIWIDDESNVHQTHARNFIRHGILSALKTRWPSVGTTLARSAVHYAESQRLLAEFAQELLCQTQGLRPNTLSVQKILDLSPERQRLVLRHWIQGSGHRVPDTKKMATILDHVLFAAWDRQPCLAWGKVVLRRYGDDLYLLPNTSVATRENINAHNGIVSGIVWNLAQELELPGLGKLGTVLTPGKGLATDIEQVRVDFRQQGETVELPSRGRLSLKKLFQEWKVPPWERGRVPLLFYEGKLIAVVGYFLDAKVKADEGGMGREIKWGEKHPIPAARP